MDWCLYKYRHLIDIIREAKTFHGYRKTIHKLKHGIGLRFDMIPMYNDSASSYLKMREISYIRKSEKIKSKF